MKRFRESFNLLSLFLLFFIVFYSSFSQAKVNPLLKATPEIREDLVLAQKLSRAFSYIAEKAAPAVVFIETEKIVRNPVPVNPLPFFSPFDFFGDNFFKKFFSPPVYRERAAGSGFIISPDGYIVTNNHVVNGAQKITVKLLDGRVFKAKIIGADPFSDVALLKINAKNLPTLPLGNSDDIKIGEWVIAIGNPFGLTHTVTVGVISAKGRSGLGISDIEDFIQTDAAINPGNSGGPLINLKGEVIGMNTAIYTRSGGYMGIGFAIPINIIKLVVNQLKTKGRVERGYLGVYIQDLTPSIAKSLGLEITEGALVTEVIPNSPAAKAGLKVKDVIIAVNGKKVKNASELKTYIVLTKPGTWVTLTIIRKGKIKHIRVKIGSPKNYYLSYSSLKKIKNFLNELGFEVSPITPSLARQMNLPTTKGVVITKVYPETPADYAGLTPGLVIDEVNQHKVTNMRDFIRAIRPSLKTKRVLLGIKTHHGRYYVTLSVEE